MGEVVDSKSLTLRLINTVNFHIWASLSTNLAIFTLSQERIIFANFVKLQSEKQDLFHDSMRFWHARHGPGMPQELVSDMMRFMQAYDFVKEQAQMYPEKLYVRVGKQFTEVTTKSAYCFAAIRKKVFK